MWLGFGKNTFLVIVRDYRHSSKLCVATLWFIFYFDAGLFHWREPDFGYVSLKKHINFHGCKVKPYARLRFIHGSVHFWNCVWLPELHICLPQRMCFSALLCCLVERTPKSDSSHRRLRHFSTTFAWRQIHRIYSASCRVVSILFLKFSYGIQTGQFNHSRRTLAESTLLQRHWLTFLDLF